MKTRIKISIDIESTVPTENLQLAERILLGRLFRALKKGETQTLDGLYKALNTDSTTFDYSCQNEVVE